MLTTSVYCGLLLLYFANMACSPSPGLGQEDRRIEGEDKFLEFAKYVKFVWLISLTLPFFLQPSSWFDPIHAIVFGAACFLLGVWIRMTAIRTLGKFFTYELTIKEDHQFVRQGIYRYLRHPSYTGSLLQVAGMMLVAQSLPGFLLCMLSGCVMFGIRIHREERMLRDEFGDSYVEYSRKTWRLIPWIV